MSIFIDILDKFKPLTEDRILACVYGGIITGLGTAIILKVGSSTGGSDLLSNIIKGFNPSIRVGNMIVIIDIIIVTLNVLFFKEIEVGLYSAIAIYIMGKIIDIIFEGVYFTKLLIIISDKNEEIAKEIGKKLNKIHKPKLDWKLLIILVVLLIFGFVISYIITENEHTEMMQEIQEENRKLQVRRSWLKSTNNSNGK